MKGIKLPGFKISKSGKVERDEGAALAKLPVNLRLARKASKRVRVVKPKG